MSFPTAKRAADHWPARLRVVNTYWITICHQQSLRNIHSNVRFREYEPVDRFIVFRSYQATMMSELAVCLTWRRSAVGAILEKYIRTIRLPDHNSIQSSKHRLTSIHSLSIQQIYFHSIILHIFIYNNYIILRRPSQKCISPPPSSPPSCLCSQLPRPRPLAAPPTSLSPFKPSSPAPTFNSSLSQLRREIST